MEGWTLKTPILLIILTTEITSWVSSECSVSLRPSIAARKVFTCTNVTSAYLETNALELNRSEWFHCDSCNLSTVTDKTLKFHTRNHILYVNLTDCAIQVVSNFAFEGLPYLKVILLRANRIAELQPKSFYLLRRLLQLDLSSNRLAVLRDEAFVHLEKLDILNLNGNQLKTLQPRTFGGLRELKYLYLSHNEITNIHPYLFKDLGKLSVLYLEDNLIKEISPLVFANLNNLIFLYLNNNQIDFLSEYNFKELSQLIDLQMRNNSLKDVPTSSFNGLRKLKFLYLGNNGIRHLAMHAFTGLDSLAILDLTNNSLQNFTLDFLGDMPKLRGLWLENNTIDELVIEKATKKHENLASFDLKNNKLHYFNYKMVLRKLECLEEIYLGNNAWKCEFFVPMIDYFEEANVTLCLDAVCDKNDTVWFTESLCKLSYERESAENSGLKPKQYNILLFLIYLFFMYTSRKS